VRHVIIIAALITITAPAAFAEAQVVIRRRGGAPVTTTQQPAQAEPQAQQSPPPEPNRPHKFGSFTIGVPLFNDVNSDIVRPGANLNFRGGIDFGFFGVFAHLGTMWNPIDLNNAPPPSPALGRSPLHRLYFGVGARLQYPHERFRPYVDLAFDINWWHFQETALVCGIWYCTGVNSYRFTPGWESRVGMQIVVRPPFAIDLGVSFAFTYPGDMFIDAEYWMEPYLGVATRF